MREDIKINDRALALEKQLIEKLELVFDTDVELDVYNLGLIYELDLDEDGICKVVVTISVPMQFVSRCFLIILEPLAPSALAAVTYSDSFKTKTCERVMRAIPTQ